MILLSLNLFFEGISNETSKGLCGEFPRAAIGSDAFERVQMAAEPCFFRESKPIGKRAFNDKFPSLILIKIFFFNRAIGQKNGARNALKEVRRGRLFSSFSSSSSSSFYFFFFFVIFFTNALFGDVGTEAMASAIATVR